MPSSTKYCDCVESIGVCWRQCGHNRRTRRCEIMPVKLPANERLSCQLPAKERLSMCRSRSAVIVEATSRVCSVVKTYLPELAARIAISAVSASRISPTSTTSGSIRSSVRSPLVMLTLCRGSAAIWR